MDIKELRAKNEGELLKDIAALQEHIRELHFKLGSQEIKNHNLISAARRDIARIKTIIAERAKEAQPEK